MTRSEKMVIYNSIQLDMTIYSPIELYLIMSSYIYLYTTRYDTK